MMGRRASAGARPCEECGRVWGRRATFCGACGARLSGAPTDRRGEGARPAPDGRARRALLVVALVGVVVGGGLVVPSVVNGPTTGDVGGQVTLPTEGGSRPAADRPEPAVGPPTITCEPAGAPADCVAWTRDASGPGGPTANGLMGTARSGPHVLAVSGRRVSVVDAADGRRVWAWDADGPLRDVRVESGMVGLGVDDRFRLVTLAAGQPQWAVDVAGSVSGDLLYGGLVFTAGPPDGADVRPSLVARRLEDGTVAWRWRSPAFWSDPGDGDRSGLRVEQLDQPHLLVRSARRLAVLDARTGTVRWTRRDTQLVAADALGVLVREQGRLRALDGATGAVRWEAALPAEPGRGGQLRVLGDLVVVAGTDVLAAIDRGTGEPRWRVATDGPEVAGHPPTPFTEADVRPVDQVLTVAWGTATVRARDAVTGEVRWEVDVPGVESVSAHAGGSVVVVLGPGGGQVVDAGTGAAVLGFRAAAPLIPAGTDPTLLFDLRSRHLVRLDVPGTPDP